MTVMTAMSGIKRHIAAAMAALMLLSGCASSEIPKKDPSHASSAQTVSATEATAAPAPETTAASPAPEEDPPADETSSAKAEAVPAAPEALPSEAREPDPAAVYARAKHIAGLRLDPTDKDGIYELKGLPEKNPDIEYHNGIVLTFSEPSEKEEQNTVIRSYDIRRGLLLGETDLFSTGYTCYTSDTCGAYDGGFYSCVTNKVRLLDIGMNVTDTFELPVTKCTRLWMSPDGRYILCNDKRGPTKLYDVRARRETELSKRVKAVSVIGCDGESFDIVNTKSERFRIMASGSVIPFGKLIFPDIYLDSLIKLDGRIIDIVPAGLFMRKPQNNTAKLVKYPPRSIHYLLCLDDRYIAFSGADDKTRVIDIENGALSEPIGCGAYAARGKGRDGSFVFLDNKDWTGNTRYLLAVPSELSFNKKIETETLDMKTEEYLLYFNKVQPDSDKSRELLDELLGKYNVRVLFSPITEKERYCGYYCKAYKGEQAHILESLRDFLALSPPELLTESTRTGAETWILISGDIVDDPELSAFGTAGFATQIGLHPFAALQIPLDENQAADYMTEEERYEYSAKYITDNFSHEFIHLLDAKTTDAQNERWHSLSPDDCYLGTYGSGGTGYSGKYVDFGKEFDNNVYFTDYYGRINDLEDKARIGENLYYARTGDVFSPRERFARSESLYNKARALCALLRENYPCLASVPEGEWYLEKPLLGSYAEMKESWLSDRKKTDDRASR